MEEMNEKLEGKWKLMEHSVNWREKSHQIWKYVYMNDSKSSKLKSFKIKSKVLRSSKTKNKIPKELEKHL